MNLRRWFAVMLCGFVLSVVSGAQEMSQKPVDPVAITVPSSTLNEYVGEYRESAEPDVPNSVYIEGDKLYIEGERMARSELRAESADHFFAPGSVMRVEFAR